MKARYVLVTLSAACSACVFGNMLKADGIVRTIGIEKSAVRLTLVPEFSEAYVVEHDGGRFDLELPYHAHYVLRAESPGCATKEVVFDANLPISRNGEERDFPLEILMERMVEGTSYHYAGPVGLVYFDEAKDDFVYTTDHERIYERSSTVVSIHQSEGRTDDGAWAMGTASPAPVGDPLAARLPKLVIGKASRPGPRPAGTGAVRVVGEGAYVPPALATAPIDREPTASLTIASIEPEVPNVMPAMEKPTPRNTAAFPLRERPTPVAHNASITPSAADPEEQEPWLRVGSANVDCGDTEQVQVARCMVTIDHLNTGTGCAELRKAEHAWGGVFYFHEGRSITEQNYRQLLGTRIIH
ncbi:MAG: hypothetical protein JNM62_02170 [Flavobacteriales bacterium]|nr:hypothetical protein [Flavobacteriales bacterium]